jgi:SWIM zinc finger
MNRSSAVHALPLEQAYRYPAPSSLAQSRGGTRLGLATSGGHARNPRLFRGLVRHPEVVADGLLAVAAVARTRFHTPPAMLARILLTADPIVTCAEERLRFESLSACCSVYARLDLLGAAVEGDLLGRGSTNVDFGPEMRVALAGVDSGGSMRLEIGLDEVEVRSGAHRAVERRVPLPARWIRALTELAAIQDGMRERYVLARADALRLLRSIGRGAGSREAWLAPAGTGVRVAHHPAAGSVRVGGPQRVRVLERVARHLTGLRIHASEDGSTAWQCDLPDGRVTLILSPDPWRGLSGEGRLLSTLATPPNRAALAAVRAQLRWQPVVTVEDVANATGLDAGGARAALAALAASGLLGVDLADRGYFHRELPFDLAAADRHHPRLRDARRLVSEGDVRVERSADDELVAWVAGSGVDHRVRVTPSGSTCTCPWFGRHRGERGPCKHVLAVELMTMALDDTDDAVDGARA